MIYTIVDEKGVPVFHDDGRPYAMSYEPTPKENHQILRLTNVEMVELYFRVQELRRYLETEKFSKEEWVDRKDVLRRLGF